MIHFNAKRTMILLLVIFQADRKAKDRSKKFKYTFMVLVVAGNVS